MLRSLFGTLVYSAGTQPSASNRTSTQNGTPMRKPMTTAAPPGSGTKLPAASPARQSTVKPAAGAHAPAVVRQNACNKYKEALVAAHKKLSTAGQPEGTDVADPAKLAEAIELACHTAFGTAYRSWHTLLPPQPCTLQPFFYVNRMSYPASEVFRACS